MFSVNEMGTPLNLTRNCTFNHSGNNESMCSFDLNPDSIYDMEHPVHLDKKSEANEMEADNVDYFEKSIQAWRSY